GATLQNFAFAMLVGILSGTYSSIFIASPLLNAWKETEPGFLRRRARMAQLGGGTVPAFADEVEMAQFGAEEEREGEPAAAGDGAQAEPEPSPVATAERRSGGADPAANGEGDAVARERRERDEARRARRQQRRKHGRKR